jgi:endonuclease/exonuclease/phosphatase family metal-dependent hydrolase
MARTTSQKQNDTKPQRSYQLKIISFNLWHGLDHTKPMIMFPVETWDQKNARDHFFIEGVKSLLQTDSPKQEDSKTGAFLCFQEVNPARRKTKILRKSLNLDGTFAEANVGIRVGPLSYPFLLQEGLATFWKNSFSPVSETPPERLVLSGGFTELKTPLISIPISLQLSERRVALVVTGLWHDYKISIVNLHLHHGNPKWKKSGDRRLSEIQSLFQKTDDLFRNQDFVFLVGDFNCYSGLPEFQYILDQGFEEISLDSKNKPIITWDPYLNKICKNSVELTQDPVIREWDEHKNPFDHIFIKKISPRAKKLKLKTSCHRLFDKPSPEGIWASDHFGLMAEISW